MFSGKEARHTFSGALVIRPPSDCKGGDRPRRPGHTFTPASEKESPDKVPQAERQQCKRGLALTRLDRKARHTYPPLCSALSCKQELDSEEAGEEEPDDELDNEELVRSEFLRDLDSNDDKSDTESDKEELVRCESILDADSVPTDRLQQNDPLLTEFIGTRPLWSHSRNEHVVVSSPSSLLGFARRRRNLRRNAQRAFSLDEEYESQEHYPELEDVIFPRWSSARSTDAPLSECSSLSFEIDEDVDSAEEIEPTRCV